jgi:hypothetical protein
LEPPDLPSTLPAKCAKFNRPSVIPRRMKEQAMTQKKDPPDPKAAEPATPADPLAGQPVEVIVEVLARVSGQMKGLVGPELRKHIAEVAGQVQALTQSIELKMRDDAQRKEAAAEVERLLDMFVRSGTEAGKVLEKHRTPIAQSLRGADLPRLAEGIRLLADWMANPTAQNEAQAKQLMQRLEETMGPALGLDPEAQDRARRAQIESDVKKSLDNIFRGPDQKPLFQYKPMTPDPKKDGK